MALIHLRVAVLLLSSGCGLSGGTKPYEVPSDERDATTLNYRVVLVAFEVEDGAAIRYMPGSPEETSAAFSAKDTRVFFDSISASFDNVTWPDPKVSRGDLMLQVVLRRHVVAMGSGRACVLAIFAWAIYEPNGRMLYHEQFYATSNNEDKMWTSTLGSLKDRVNEVAINRIVESSLAAASQGRIDISALEGTYDSLKEAEATLYTNFIVVPIVVPREPGDILYRRTKTVHPGATGQVIWSEHDLTAPVDWEARQ